MHAFFPASLCRFAASLWEKKSEHFWQVKVLLWYNSSWKRATPLWFE